MESLFPSRSIEFPHRSLTGSDWAHAFWPTVFTSSWTPEISVIIRWLWHQHSDTQWLLYDLWTMRHAGVSGEVRNWWDLLTSGFATMTLQGYSMMSHWELSENCRDLIPRGPVPSPATQEYFLWKLGLFKKLKSLNIPQPVVFWYNLPIIYTLGWSESSVTSVRVQFREHIFDKLLRTFCSSLNQSCSHRNAMPWLVRSESHDSERPYMAAWQRWRYRWIL